MCIACNDTSVIVINFRKSKTHAITDTYCTKSMSLVLPSTSHFRFCSSDRIILKIQATTIFWSQNTIISIDAKNLEAIVSFTPLFHKLLKGVQQPLQK